MALRLSGIAAGYGVKTVISDVSFALAPGQILAFLGHNGAGKTTTLKTIMGLLPARAGSVTFDEKRIDRMDVAARVAMGLRLLPEGRGIFPDLDVAENIDVVAARTHRLGEITRQDRSAAIVVRRAEKNDRPRVARELSRHLGFSALYGDACMRPLIDCSDPAKPAPARHAAF